MFDGCPGNLSKQIPVLYAVFEPGIKAGLEALCEPDVCSHIVAVDRLRAIDKLEFARFCHILPRLGL